jgi:uncharacterized protein (DUF924 family)
MLPVDAILAFWFEYLDDTQKLYMNSPQCRRWHAKDPETDRDIISRFAAVYERCRKNPLPTASAPRERLALVLLFDQFTRNMFRDTARMYEADGDALQLAKNGIAQHADDKLPLIYRMFLYMPLMHSEAIADQDRTIDLFRGLLEDAREKSPENVGFFEMASGYARQHRDIIATHGRFPHRNALLGRPNSPAEEMFLADGHAGF